MEKNKALLLEMIGEDAVIEGVDFDFEGTTFANAFGGKTITVNEACRIKAASERFGNCVVLHCTDEEITSKMSENVLAGVIAGEGEKLPKIYGKALVFRQLIGTKSGFECFTDSEINELIDLCDEIVRKFVEEQG